MNSLDIFGGILLGIQVMLYNRLLPFYTLYVMKADFVPPLIKPLVVIIYIFNMIMLISSSSKVYTAFRTNDEKEKRYHYSMIVAGIIVVMLFNVIAEILLTKFRAL